MRKRLLLIAVVAFFSYNFFLPQVPPKIQENPLKIQQIGPDFLSLSWEIQNLELSRNLSNKTSISQITFEDCSFPQKTGDFEVPIMSFLIGIPENAEISFELPGLMQVYPIKSIPGGSH